MTFHREHDTEADRLRALLRELWEELTHKNAFTVPLDEITDHNNEDLLARFRREKDG